MTNPLYTELADETSSSSDSSVTDWFVKGIPSAVISGGVSIANTAEYYADKVNLGWGQLDTINTINNIAGGDAADYALEHIDGVELGGDLLGSIIPGTLAIKGLKLAQAGLHISKLTGAATGLLNNTAEVKLLNKARVAMEGLDMVAARKARFLAAGAAGLQTGLEFAAFEAGTYAAMNQSPTYQNKSIGEVVLHSFETGLIFGGLAAPFKYFSGMNKQFKVDSGSLANETTTLNTTKDFIGSEISRVAKVDLKGAFGNQGDLLVSLTQALHTKPAQSSYADIQSSMDSIYALRNTKLISAIQTSLTDTVAQGELRQNMLDVIKRGDMEEVAGLFGGLEKMEYVNKSTWGDLTSDIGGRLKANLSGLMIHVSDGAALDSVRVGETVHPVRHFTANSNIASMFEASGEREFARLPAATKYVVEVSNAIANDAKKFVEFQNKTIEEYAAAGKGYIEFQVKGNTIRSSIIGEALISEIDALGDDVIGAATQGASIFRNMLTGETSSYAHINLATLEASARSRGERVVWGDSYVELGKNTRIKLFRGNKGKLPTDSPDLVKLGSDFDLRKLSQKMAIGFENSLVTDAEHVVLVEAYKTGKLVPLEIDGLHMRTLPKITATETSFSPNALHGTVIAGMSKTSGAKVLTNIIGDAQNAAAYFPKVRAAYEADKLIGRNKRLLSQEEKDMIYLSHIAETFNYLTMRNVHPAEAFARMGISVDAPIVEKLLTSNYETALLNSPDVTKLLYAASMEDSGKIAVAFNEMVDSMSRETVEMAKHYEVRGSASLRRIMDGTITVADIKKNDAVWAKLNYSTKGTLDAWEQKGMAEWDTHMNALQEERIMLAEVMLGVDALPKLDIAKVNFADIDKSAGFLKSADARYNSTLEAASYVGKIVQGFTEKMRNSRASALLQVEQKLRAAGPTSETAITLNAVFQRLKSTEEQVILFYNKRSIVTQDYAIANGLLVYGKSTTHVLAAQQRLLSDPNGGIILWRDKLGIFDYFEALEKVDLDYRHANNLISTMLGKPVPKRYPTGSIYVPPYDLTETPHVLLVRSPDGSKSILRGRTAEELQKKARIVRENFPEMTLVDQTDISAYKKFVGEYNHEAAFYRTVTDMKLENKGILHDVDIKSGFQELDNINNWLSRKEFSIARGLITAHYGKEFAEASLMSKITNPYNDSKLIPVGTRAPISKDGKDAYTDIIKTALNLTDAEAYPYWQHTNTYINELATGIAEKIWEIGHMLRKDKLPIDQANLILSNMGVKDALYTPELWKLAAMPNMSNVAFEAVCKVRHGISTAILRLEHMNAIVQSIAMPIMTSPAMANALKNAQTIEEIPSQVMLYKNAFKALGDKDLLELYRKQYLISPSITNGVAAIDAAGQIMAATSNQEILRLANTAQSAMGKFVNTVAKPTDYVEHMQRFVAVNIGHQLAIAQGMLEGSPKFWAYVNNFANKASGNYTAGQRPAIFQGIVGQVIGVFQTYQFNMMQQFAKYIAEGDKKALAMQLALQGTIFGATSMPAFNLINQQLIGEYTQDRSDIYSKVQEYLPTRLGQTFLYGGASTMLNAALWTRGDVNPRTPTIVPILPQDMALLSMTAKAAGSLFDITKAILKQGSDANPDLKISVGEAIAHAGINRPLAGIAEMAIGARTSEGGKLDTNLLGQDIMAIGTAIRILGAKPLDESIALDAYQRQLKYKAKSTKVLNSIGEDLRTQLMGDGNIDPSTLDAFAEKYSKAGGDLKTFRQFYLRALRDVSTPRAIQLLNSMKNSPYALQYQMAMGSHFRELEGTPQEEPPQELPIEENVQ